MKTSKRKRWPFQIGFVKEGLKRGTNTAEPPPVVVLCRDEIPAGEKAVPRVTTLVMASETFFCSSGRLVAPKALPPPAIAVLTRRSGSALCATPRAMTCVVMLCVPLVEEDVFKSVVASRLATSGKVFGLTTVPPVTDLSLHTSTPQLVPLQLPPAAALARRSSGTLLSPQERPSVMRITEFCWQSAHSGLDAVGAAGGVNSVFVQIPEPALTGRPAK